MLRVARLVLTLAAGVALLLALRQTWTQHRQAGGLDFYIYWVNAQLQARDDIDDIYSAETQLRIGEEYYARGAASESEVHRYDARRRRQLDNVSSPFLYTTLRWVSDDYPRARVQYLVAVALAFLAGTILCCRAAAVCWPATLFLCAGLVVWYGGFEADLRVGNVNSLQLFVLGAIVWLESRTWPTAYRAGLVRFAAAALAGMLVMFKPNVLYAVLLVLVARAMARQWRVLATELAGGAAGAIAAVVTAAISYGSFRVWLQWPAAAGQFWQRLQPRGDRNVAPALELFQQYGTGLSHAITVALLLVVCAASWRGRSRVDAPLLAGAGLLIYLLASTVVWLHYMVLVLPAAIALLRWRGTAMLSLLALLVIAEKPYLRLSGAPIYPAEAHVLAAGIVLLFACAVWKIARPSVTDLDPRPAAR